MCFRCQQQNVSPWPSDIRAAVTHDTATQLAAAKRTSASLCSLVVLILAVWLQIGGKHANFRPTGEAAGSDQAMWCSPCAHVHTQRHTPAHRHICNPNSENGNMHQLTEITPVVKIWPSRERRVSQNTFTQSMKYTTIHLTLAHTHMDSQACKQCTTTTSCVFQTKYGTRLCQHPDYSAHSKKKNNGPIGTRLALWHHPHVGSGVLSKPEVLII